MLSTEAVSFVDALIWWTPLLRYPAPSQGFVIHLNLDSDGMTWLSLSLSFYLPHWQWVGVWICWSLFQLQLHPLCVLLLGSHLFVAIWCFLLQPADARDVSQFLAEMTVGVLLATVCRALVTSTSIAGLGSLVVLVLCAWTTSTRMGLDRMASACRTGFLPYQVLSWLPAEAI